MPHKFRLVVQCAARQISARQPEHNSGAFCINARARIGRVAVPYGCCEIRIATSKNASCLAKE